MATPQLLSDLALPSSLELLGQQIDLTPVQVCCVLAKVSMNQLQADLGQPSNRRGAALADWSAAALLGRSTCSSPRVLGA